MNVHSFIRKQASWGSALEKFLQYFNSSNLIYNILYLYTEKRGYSNNECITRNSAYFPKAWILAILALYPTQIRKSKSMIQVVSIHINTDRPKELGAFYQQLFNVEPAWQSDEIRGFMFGDFRLEVAKHDAVSGKNNQPARIFFDLMVDDVRTEFDRIVGLGATAVQEPYDFTDEDMAMVIATLADLDGNYFQLVSMG